MNQAELKLHVTNLVLSCIQLGTKAQSLTSKEIDQIVEGLSKKLSPPFIASVIDVKDKLDKTLQAFETAAAKPSLDDPQDPVSEVPIKPEPKKRGGSTRKPQPLLVSLPAALVDSLNKLPEPASTPEETAPAPAEAKKRGRKQATKDGEEPKLNSYHQFFKDTRPSVAAANPTWAPQQITTEIGRLWSERKETSSTEVETAPAPAPIPEPELILEQAQEQEVPADEEKRQPLHVRRKKIPKNIRSLVWNKYIGSDITAAKCMCCREEKVTLNNWHCGHVIAEARGGDSTINNLRPICAPCNSSMGTKSMNEFTEEFFGWSITA